MKKKVEKFPKSIVVTHEQENKSDKTGYLLVQDDGLDSITEEREVAVYVLDSVSRLRITRTLE